MIQQKGSLAVGLPDPQAGRWGGYLEAGQESNVLADPATDIAIVQRNRRNCGNRIWSSGKELDLASVSRI